VVPQGVEHLQIQGTLIVGLPIVVASGFIGDPGLEIGLGRVRVVVLVVLAVIPVVLLMPLAIPGLPLIVDVDVVVLLAVGPLCLIVCVVLCAPLRGLCLAVKHGAIRFAVLEVSIGVVVLGVLVPVCRSTLMGKDGRNH
jgi:hypothetical protein